MLRVTAAQVHALSVAVIEQGLKPHEPVDLVDVDFDRGDGLVEFRFVAQETGDLVNAKGVSIGY